MASTHVSTASTGSDIVLTGLVVQIVLFGFFVAVALIFHRRMGATPTPKSEHIKLPWTRLMYILYITSTFILTRCIVRVAEFVECFEGYIILHEVFLYTLDAVPMAAVAAMLGIWYPAACLNQVTPTKVDGPLVESKVELSEAGSHA
jgi:hypothetical protein